jgi:glycosyltransferase involved in cell wall biosynthesis
MNICHIIVGLGDGGAEACLYKLILSTSSCRHFVVSLTSNGKYGPLLEAHGIRVYSLGLKKSNPLSFIRIFHALRIIKNFSPSIVQSWMYHSNLLSCFICFFLSVPLVWGIHNTVVTIKDSGIITYIIARACSFFSFFIPSAIIYCAFSAASYHHSIGYKSSISHVILNGYDPLYFKPLSRSSICLREQLKIPASTFVIGMAARFNVYKDHPNLLHAIHHLSSVVPDFRLLLVGDNILPSNNTLTSLISSLHLHKIVHLLGPCPDIPSFMNSIDVHVLSSSAEAFPNVLSEAMLCGTPCVSTDVGDASHIVGTYGWIVPTKNPLLLSSALHAAYISFTSSPEWLTSKNACRLHVSRSFTIQSMSDSYYRVWSSLT